jgi:streptogramin lyase
MLVRVVQRLPSYLARYGKLSWHGPASVATGVILNALACSGAIAAEVSSRTQGSIAELAPHSTIHLGKTADWVAITDEAVWVGSTGPNAVSQIDSRTNKLLATIRVPGAPCAGLAVGFGGLWVPLCGKPNSLVRVDLHTRKVTLVPGVGPAGQEGGIATSSDSIWLVVDQGASLARIDPNSRRIRQTVPVPAGSYLAEYAWVRR